MQAMGGNSLVQRMIGAARLDVPTYEEVEHDEKATPQAAIVVVLVAIASGIGGAGDETSGLIAGLLSALIGWVVIAALVYFVGTRLLATTTTSATLGEVARTVGFSYTANLLAIFGFIPVIGPIIALVAGILATVALFIAVRQSLDISTGRAIAVALVALLIRIIIAAILFAIF